MTFIIGINDKGWMEVRARRGKMVAFHTVRTRGGIKRVIQGYVNRFKLREDEIVIMRSSSVDFPEESTKRPSVIALARSL